MSQRPSASRPTSQSPPVVQRITLPPVQLRDGLQSGGREGSRQLPEMEGRGLIQPSRSGQTSPSGEGWRPPPASRDLGVHSMLNPTEPEGSGSTEHPSRGPPSQSPSSVIGPSPHFGNSPVITSSHTFSHQQHLSGPPSMVEGFGGSLPRVRRVMTPRSPRPFGVTRAGAHHIDATATPFLGRGRPQQAFHGYIESPSMTYPPVSQGQYQQPYGFGAAPTPIAPRRTSGGPMQASGQMPPSQSASPSVSVSSYNPSSNQTSPAAFTHKGPHTLQSITPYHPGSSFGSSIQHGGGSQFQEATVTTEGPYSTQAPFRAQGDNSLHSSSASSSRQTSASDPIQVLTITTRDGTLTVPVDTQQASKGADEKRKRNAGASARFRQRRKESEKESTISISKLNQQASEMERKLREVEAERDFYRQERNRFRDVVYNTAETRHLAQGPPSPHTMQSNFPSQQARIGPPSPQERAPRRRRTDARGDFANVPYAPHPPSSVPPVQSAYQSIIRPSGPNLPPLRLGAPPLSQLTGPAVTTPSTEPPPPTFPPFPPGSYERGWQGEGGRR